MPREGAYGRGMRMLTEHRLTVTRMTGREIEATCRGDSGELRSVGYRPGQWYCDCPARTTCAHLWALQAVVLRPGSAP